ncbi:mitochondrial transcription rescue factor 1 [Epargyreus clarus]|uniref:mitochondrial transcription rescue factor 1 n=1 Tax=Epargyreus clarus TaxID=520877 RepID=UPI003C2DF021
MLRMNSLWLRSVRPLITCAITQEFSKRALYSLSIASVNSTNRLTKSNVTNVNYTIIRHKSKKKHDEDSDNEEDFLGDDTSLSKDSKVVTFSTTSLRTDAVLKSALGIARNKIEKLFYESKIRVNGKKIMKKSANVRPEYEIDVIKHVSPHNPDHLYVARVEIINIVAKEESISFTVRRFKNLLIENYDKDPYKSGDTEGEQ